VVLFPSRFHLNSKNRVGKGYLKASIDDCMLKYVTMNSTFSREKLLNAPKQTPISARVDTSEQYLQEESNCNLRLALFTGRDLLKHVLITPLRKFGFEYM
jgi:hypothetical protein